MIRAAFALLFYACALFCGALFLAWIIGSASADTFVPNPSGVIPQANWKLLFVDSEELVEENGAAINAFDGNAATIWHTFHSPPPAPPPPHEIQIDLGATYTIQGFRYLPRQLGGANGGIAQYEFYVSAGGVWALPVATGTFSKDATEKEVAFAPQTGRYIRLRALTEINGNPWTSVAEINVLGILAAPPSIAISWQDTNTTEKGFFIESAPTATGPFQQVGQVGANVKQFTETDHYDYSRVCYRVQAFNDAKQSPYSNVTCVDIPPDGIQAPDEQLTVTCNLLTVTQREELMFLKKAERRTNKHATR